MKSVIETMFGVVTFDDGQQPDIVIEEIPHALTRVRAQNRFFPFEKDYDFEPRQGGDESDLIKRVQKYLLEEGLIGSGNKGIRVLQKS